MGPVSEESKESSSLQDQAGCQPPVVDLCSAELEAIIWARINLVRWLWLVKMPEVYSHIGFTRADALQTWVHLMNHPDCPRLDRTYRAVLELWDIHVAKN
jgi:hypothetical protein